MFVEEVLDLLASPSFCLFEQEEFVTLEFYTQNLSKSILRNALSLSKSTKRRLAFCQKLFLIQPDNVDYATVDWSREDTCRFGSFVHCFAVPNAY